MEKTASLWKESWKSFRR